MPKNPIQVPGRSRKTSPGSREQSVSCRNRPDNRSGRLGVRIDDVVDRDDTVTTLRTVPLRLLAQMEGRARRQVELAFGLALRALAFQFHWCSCDRPRLILTY